MSEGWEELQIKERKENAMLRNIAILVVACALALATPANAESTEKPMAWKTVGADPCNPKVGCTLKWAMLYAWRADVWPKEVGDRFLKVVKETSPTETTITKGWRGFMTYGYHKRKFRKDVVADFSQEEPAQLWQVRHDGKTYNLIKVRKCGNWGGWVSLTPLPERPRREMGRMPLGVIPVVVCPPQSQEEGESE